MRNGIRIAGTVAGAFVLVFVTLVTSTASQPQARERVRPRQEATLSVNITINDPSGIYVQSVEVDRGDTVAAGGGFGAGSYVRIKLVSDSPHWVLQDILLRQLDLLAYRTAIQSNTPIANPYYTPIVDPAEQEEVTPVEDTLDCYLYFYIFANDLVVDADGNVINFDDLSGLTCEAWE